MAKPIIKKITPFDANNDYEVGISWTGNRAYKNRIVIYDNDTLAVVFDETITSFSLTHTIPAYTLQNGIKYVIQCQVFDEEDIASALSDKLAFYTFETPEFRFTNIPEGNKISAASFTASLVYASPDWENISTYRFYLYDASKRQLLQSNSFYDDENIGYTYRGLENDTVYYIRSIGTTVNGMPLDTGYVQIYVKYENPNTYARIYATNDPINGCIRYGTNLIIIQYNGTESFEYENGMIDLTDKTLYYDEGFLIEDDFTLILRGINLYQTAEILKMKNGTTGLTLSSRIYHEGKIRFKLSVPNGIGKYILYSDELVFENTDMVTLCIRRKNNIYQLDTFIELGFSPTGNMWIGNMRPTNSAENYDVWIEAENSTFKVDKNAISICTDLSEPDAQLHTIWIGGE